MVPERLHKLGGQFQLPEQIVKMFPVKGFKQDGPHDQKIPGWGSLSFGSPAPGKGVFQGKIVRKFQNGIITLE